MSDVTAAIARLEHDGLVILRAVVASAEVDRLRQAFEPAGDGGYTEHVDVDSNTVDAELWFALAERCPVKEIVSTVLGGEAEVRLHGRNPLPGGGRQGLHADQPPAPGSDGPLALTLIWMLDDFNEHNGATRVVPGSHRRRSMVPRSLAQPRCSHPEECTVSGAAGDVVVMDSHLWHAGARNASSGMRRSIQMIIGAST